MISRNVLLLCLFVALSVRCSSAFVAPTNWQIVPQQRQPPLLNMVTEIKEEANWRTLPNRASSTQNEPKIASVVATEIYIGRIAMLGFVGLVVGEVLTGESFSQQFIDAFWFLMGAKP